MGNIIDSHFHLGSCRVFDADFGEADVNTAMEENGVDRMILQPYPGAPDPVAVHDRIAAMARTSERIFGLASLSPHMDHAAYHAEVSRCVKELGFVGVKLHTLGHAVNPRSRDGEVVFSTAKELGVCVMVHTGAGVPFADPAQVASRARQFPDVTIVLAHAGMGIFSGSAIAMAESFDNIVLEPSWCRPPDIAQMVKLVGSGRVMLGTDHPLNVGPELAKYRSLGLSQQQLDDVLGGTAQRVFNLPA